MAKRSTRNTGNPPKEDLKTSATANLPKDDQKTSTEKESVSKKAFIIVGVGASAGGFEAFKELLEALPHPTGMAFIFIQHLEPTHESMLATLLGRSTGMSVIQASDGMAVEADHVYVAPPNANLIILNGVLTLQTIDKSVGRHKTIDFFFRSLASDQGHRAVVGVLLSGTASDGVLGLKAIKAEGGITLVQDESAKFDSMPRSAIQAGVSDLVLPPAEIAKELIKLKNHFPHLIRMPLPIPEDPKLPEEQDDLRRVLALVWAVSHVDFTVYKQSTLRRRILRRMVLHKLEKLSQYVKYLEDNTNEVKALYQDLVINVTSFFRDPEVFEALKEEIFPQLLAGKSPNAPLRLWIPGCSTGEEVYSLAICILESLSDKSSSIPIQIFGTDISEVAVDRARAGIYSENIEVDVSPERLRRFFVKGEAGYQVSKPIRDLCIFARQNVFKDPPFSNLDLISCRNVLIYFGPELQKKVLPIFHYALTPNGYLLLGNSESIGAFADLFALAHKRHKIYLKKSVSPRMILDLATRGEYSLDRPGAVPALQEGVSKSFDPQKEADRLLLDRYSPPGVLVNSDMNILQFRGRTGLFMEPAPGGASFNLLRMTREGLMIPLHTAIHEATESGRTIRKGDVLFKGNGGSYRVTLEVVPVSSPAGAVEKFFLVLFQDLRKADGPEPRQGQDQKKESSAAGPEVQPSEQEEEIQHLRQDLSAAKEYLQSVIESQKAFNEELRSANEEILSSNEELQSTNEELETAKEELQSANEELTTLNEELQTRNQELARVNDDLTNLLNSINIAIVMLDNNLRVRRFTPYAEKLFNLIPSDLGRPFSDINPRISVPDLAPFIREVLNTLSMKEVEVQDGKGHWYNLRVRPYKTMDNKIDGVVLALMDIDMLKEMLRKSRVSLDTTEQALEYAEAVIDTVREPLLVLTSDLKVKTGNRSFYGMFRVSPDITQDRYLYELGDGQWNIPQLRDALGETVRKGTNFEDLVVERTFPNLGPRKLALNARRLRLKGDSQGLILLAIEDRTE